MPDRPDLLREAVRRPLPLAYHPLYRFYEGGSLTRAFRGLPQRPDDWWSEDWVGSCTRAGNNDPDGRPQGLSPVDVPGAGPVPLAEIVEALPGEMVGAGFAQAWGPITGVLVKLLSPVIGPHRPANSAPTISSGQALTSSTSVTGPAPGTSTGLRPCGWPSGPSLPARVHEPTQSSDHQSSGRSGSPRKALVREPPR